METNEKNQEIDNLKAGLNPVYQSMLDWEAYRNIYADVSDYFSQGNMFEFTVNMNGSEYLHAYPAVLDGELVFQVITSDNDVERNFTDLVPPPNVLTSPVKQKDFPSGGVGGPIPQPDAAVRVANWDNLVIRDEWMLTQTANCNMYQCFVIPGEDIESNVKHAAYFALKNGEEDDYIADLIIINLAEGQIVGRKLGTIYYDMTRPVPPYKLTDGLAKVNFGLLNYVEKL